MDVSWLQNFISVKKRKISTCVYKSTHNYHYKSEGQHTFLENVSWHLLYFTWKKQIQNLMNVTKEKDVSVACTVFWKINIDFLSFYSGQFKPESYPRIYKFTFNLFFRWSRKGYEATCQAHTGWKCQWHTDDPSQANTVSNYHKKKSTYF
jgi:hypothetical protein